jgi:hypothetical protein
MQSFFRRNDIELKPGDKVVFLSLEDKKTVVAGPYTLKERAGSPLDHMWSMEEVPGEISENYLALTNLTDAPAKE